MKSAFVLILAMLVVIMAVVLAGYQERRDTLFEESRLAAPPDFSPPPSSPCPETGGRCPEFQGSARLRRIVDPIIVHRVAPKPTAAARKHKIAGVVILQVGIRRDGTVGDACVLKPLPCGLSEAAIAAVKQWRFERPEADGVANVAVHFPAASTSF